MSGRLIGAALSGYDKGRRNRQDEVDWREDRDWRLSRRDRAERIEGYQDPYDEAAAANADAAGRDEEAFRTSGLPERYRARDRETKTSEDDFGFEQADLGNRARRAIRSEDESESAYQQGLRDAKFKEETDPNRYVDEEQRMEQNARTSRRGERTEAEELEEAQYMPNRVGREEQTASNEMAASNRENVYGARDMDQDTRQVAAEDFKRQGDNAVAIFAETGNKQALEDFYNDVYPDDGQVVIEKLPDGTYRADFGEGFGEPQTREAIVEGSKQFFANAPQMSDYAPSGYGGFSGGRRGRGGRRGATGKLAGGQWEGQLRVMIEDKVKYDGMSVGEATMEAHREIAYKNRMSPDEAIQKFEMTMQQELLGKMGDMKFKSAEEQDALIGRVTALAGKLTDEFARKYYGAGSAGEGGGGGEGGGEGGGLSSIDGGDAYLDDLLNDQF